jgi:hypothetical protein
VPLVKGEWFWKSSEARECGAFTSGMRSDRPLLQKCAWRHLMREMQRKGDPDGVGGIGRDRLRRCHVRPVLRDNGLGFIRV